MLTIYRGALLIIGTMQVQSEFAEATVEHRVEGEASLDFSTSLDFYNTPFRMCIEMDQPPFDIRYRYTI